MNEIRTNYHPPKPVYTKEEKKKLAIYLEELKKGRNMKNTEEAKEAADAIIRSGPNLYDPDNILTKANGFIPMTLNIGHGKILLFKGRGMVSKGISWFTRGQYSHAAVLTPKHTIIESWQGKGVRERDLLDDWSDVDCFDLNSSLKANSEYDEFWPIVIDEARTQLGKKYDYRAILRFITRKRKLKIDDRWFCSELVYWACQRAGVNLLADTVHPSLVSPELLSYSPLLIKVPLFVEEEEKQSPPDWDSVKWRQLSTGELVQRTDWVDMANDGWRDKPKWVLAGEVSVGTLAPDPQYPSHRRFRRILNDSP